MAPFRQDPGKTQDIRIEERGDALENEAGVAPSGIG